MAASGQRVLIVGATSAMAQHCARAWAQRGAAAFILVGRDARRMEPIVADLQVRAPQADIRVLTGDLLSTQGVRDIVDQACEAGRIDLALIAHGSLPDQHDCQNDLEQCRTALEVNGVSPVLFAEAIAGRMARAGFGTLGIISSVAGDRGRRSNYVYGAAKGMVTRYAQGLQHRLAGSPVRVTLIKPGPTDTPMTSQLRERGASLAPVESVAAAIVTGMDQGRAVVYAPVKWAAIMMVIRHLPRFLFNKLDI
ncbi:SDR family NAD(P)-dependent oxidoreductase [Alcaligenaceae bacterium]|nr:SDR family NAD(P)-dependent oxidoreductase [Alcaligenaceae bacterium]